MHCRNQLHTHQSSKKMVQFFIVIYRLCAFKTVRIINIIIDDNGKINCKTKCKYCSGDCNVQPFFCRSWSGVRPVSVAIFIISTREKSCTNESKWRRKGTNGVFVCVCRFNFVASYFNIDFMCARAFARGLSLLIVVFIAIFIGW